jgi:hypothetical protein
VRADAGAVAEHDAPLEDAADVDRDIAAAAQRAAQVEARGIRDRRPRAHERLGEPELHDPLDIRELRAVVDAARVALVGRDDRVDRHAVGNRGADDVGQVVLVLRVVRRQLRDPRGE